MDLDKNKTVIDKRDDPPELEQAIDAFLSGADSDDFDKMIERVQSLDPPPEEKVEARSSKRKKKPRRSAVARWIPRFKPSDRKMAAPVPDARRLPPEERELSKEPTFGPAARVEGPQPEISVEAQAPDRVDTTPPEVDPIEVQAEGAGDAWDELWSMPPHADSTPSPIDGARAQSLLYASEEAVDPEPDSTPPPREDPADLPEAEGLETAPVTSMQANAQEEEAQGDLSFEEEVRRLREVVEEGRAEPMEQAQASANHTQALPELDEADLDELELGLVNDTTLSIPAEVMADAFAQAAAPDYEAPKPPPTDEFGHDKEVDPFHASTDGLHPSTEWRTFAPKQPAAPPAPATAAMTAAAAAGPALRGPTLAERLDATCEGVRQGFGIPADFDLTTRISAVARVCEAIASAHAVGRVHGDIRPANVGLGEFGDVQVVGWDGSAPLGETLGLGDVDATFFQITSDPGRMTLLTAHGPVVGSPCYLAPEQLSGRARKATVASDVYALGLMVFEAATLSPAFGGGTLATVTNAAMEGRLSQKPIAGGEVVPKALVGIILKATKLAAGGRHGDAGDLLAALRAWLGEGRKGRAPSLAWAAGGAAATAAAAAVMAGIIGTGHMEELESQVSEVVAEAAMVHALDEAERSTILGAQVLSHSLDRYQDLATALAHSAAEIQRHAPASRSTLYRLYEFRTEGRQPDDLRDAPSYNGPISLSEPMFKLSPRSPFQQMRAESKRAAWGSDRLKGAFFSAATHGQGSASLNEEAIIGGASPVHRAFLAFDSGLDVIFPGQAGYPDNWEGRDQAWYLPTRASSSPVWGQRYEEVHGCGQVMPVTAPILGADDHFYGVAGLEIVAERFAERLIPAGGDGAISSAWLVDPSAQVILSASREGGDAEPMPIPSFQAGMASQAHGSIEIEGGSIAAWAPVEATGWVYVTLAQPEDSAAPTVDTAVAHRGH